MILVECPQSAQHDREAALHVGSSRTTRFVSFARELLERAVRLEHGIHVADEEHSFPTRPLAFTRHVAASMDFFLWNHPAGKAQGFKLWFQEVSHLANASRIQSAAVDIDHLLQQVFRSFLIRVHGSDNLPLHRGERLGRRNRSEWCERSKEL